MDSIRIHPTSRPLKPPTLHTPLTPLKLLKPPTLPTPLKLPETRILPNLPRPHRLRTSLKLHTPPRPLLRPARLPLAWPVPARASLVSLAPRRQGIKLRTGSTPMIPRHTTTPRPTIKRPIAS